MKEIILASTSSYRAALLERLFISFKTQDSGVDEDVFKEQITDPQLLSETLAKEKALAVYKMNPKAIIIAGDQLLCFEGEILGKPGSQEKAIAQLQRIQGKTHELLTSTCLISEKEIILWTEKIQLTMKVLNKEECSRYVLKDNPIDCAGSYKIESLGISLFDHLTATDHTAIVGLPLIRLSKELKKLDVEIP